MSDPGRLFDVRPKRVRGPASRGLGRTFTALRAVGRLEPVDEALVALARVAASELDAACADPDESRYTRGVLVARYHAVLTHLLALPMPDDDALTALDRLFAGVDDEARP